MRGRIRPFLSVMAIFAIALHALLWAAVAPLIAAPSVDPFSVICHSEASGPADPNPNNGPLRPAKACDHCNLCSAVAPPMPGTSLAANIKPARILQVPCPVIVARHDALTANPKLARGPPVIA